MEKKKRGLKLVLLFFVIAIILALAITFLFLKEKTQTSQIIEEGGIPPFKVDQILIKVLLKEDEIMARPINIMNTYKEDLDIEIKHQHLLDMVSVSDSKFTIRPGQTKTVQINFKPVVDEKGIKQKPGAYVGNLLFTNNLNIVRTPTIIEIETKNVLFDANMEVPIGQKQIEQGNYLDVKITLFNLKKIGLTNLDVEYFVKDIMGNTIITETESVIVETQASFVKTIHISKNLNPGEYVFGAIVRYGSSVGTSTLLFEVAEPEAEKGSLIGFYRNNKLLCWILLVILAISISAIGSHISFLIGLFLHGKTVQHHVHHHIHHIKREAGKITPKESKEEKKIVKKEIKDKGFKHKRLLLFLFFLFIILSAAIYLVYSKIITLEKMGYLGSLMLNWIKNIAAEIWGLIKNARNWLANLWGSIRSSLSRAYIDLSNRSTPYYKRYLYYAWAAIIGLIVAVCFIAIAKKNSLLKKFKERLIQRNTEKAEKRGQLKKEEKKEAKKAAKKEAKESIFENFKKLPMKGKIIIFIILAVLFLMALVSVLIDLGILSAEQFGMGNIPFLK